jgi:hypothetical protein
MIWIPGGINIQPEKPISIRIWIRIRIRKSCDKTHDLLPRRSLISEDGYSAPAALGMRKEAYDKIPGGINIQP